MTTAPRDHDGWPTATRNRLLNAAIELFNRYGFAGTSLQMIASELGLTKAAIYYHFRTREQLLVALMEPILGEIGSIVDTAERQRSARARAEFMLSGYANIVARHRSLAAVTAFDPSVRAVLRNHAEWSVVIQRQLALLAATESGTGGAINAAVVLTGLAGGAASAPDDMDDDALRQRLVDIGRRALGMPVPTGPTRRGSSR